MLIEHGAPRVYRHILHRGYRGATTWGSMDSWEAHLCKLFLCASFLVDVWMILFGLWCAQEQGDGELSAGQMSSTWAGTSGQEGVPEANESVPDHPGGMLG